MRRIDAIPFFCLLAATLLATACGTAAEVPEDTKAPSVTAPVETEAVTEAKDPFEGLAEVDYNGREFHFLVRNFNLDEQWAETQTGEVFNDSVYRRNQMVEEHCNVKIVAIPINGEWEDRTTFLKTVRGSVYAGDGAYDLIDGYAATIGDGFADGLYLNLNEIPNLRLDSAWWSSLIRKELTVNDRLYAITGDISTNMWEQMQVLYFNKAILSANDLPSPYQLVKEGKWTFDCYLSMIKGIGADINGDGKMSREDHYGALYFDALTFDNLHNAFGISYACHQADGSVTLDLLNEKTVKISELAYNLAFNNEDVFFENKGVGESRVPTRQMFMEGQGLFFASVLDDASVMREMANDFGILPYPKENEEQKAYYTTSRDGRSMFVIPMDTPDAAFTGMITEALCVAGSNQVIPVYYDTVLKGKTARDEESAEMLDLIRAGFVLDFAAEYACQNERAGFIIRDCIEGKKDISSLYASKEKTYTKAFNKFMETYSSEKN